MLDGVPVEPRAAEQRVRIGAFVAVVVTVVCACVTLLVAATTVYTTVFFATDHELSGSAWLAVAFLVALTAISGLATSYLGRRGIRELRRNR